jgi:hypothetical protein
MIGNVLFNPDHTINSTKKYAIGVRTFIIGIITEFNHIQARILYIFMKHIVGRIVFFQSAVGASIAMILSLFVALTVTPYLGYHLLHEKDEQEHKEEQGLETSWIYRIYKKIEEPLLDNSKKRNLMFLVTGVLLIGSVLMFFTKSVAVKMLPFDNKNEFQVVIDMPEGTTLERTATDFPLRGHTVTVRIRFKPVIGKPHQYLLPEYLFRYHRQTVSTKTIGILYARKQNVRYGCQPDLRKYTECHLSHIQYHPERTGKADKGLSQDHPFYGIHHTPHHGRSVRYGRSRYPFAAERGMVAFHSFLPTALSWRLLHHTDCHQQ